MTQQALMETYLSVPRFEPYLKSMGGDVDGAIQLYRWNTELAGALHSLVSNVEVLVRNSMNRALADWNTAQGMPAEWSLQHQTGQLVYDLSGRVLHRARNYAQTESNTRRVGHPRKGLPPTHDDVIAQLTLGSWSVLLGETSNPDQTKVLALWTQGLHAAFPGVPADDAGRYVIGSRMERLRVLRNRVSHQENLLEVKVKNRVLDMAFILGKIDKDYPGWAMYQSRVRAIAAQDPRRTRDR